MPKQFKTLREPSRSYASDCKGYIPISEDRAKEWAEINLVADDYMNIFGEVKERKRGGENPPPQCSVGNLWATAN